MNTLTLPDTVTILLGRKPIDVPRPAVFKHEVIIETFQSDPFFGTPFTHSQVTAQSFQLFSRDKLFAISNRCTLRKDSEGKITLRLFKNRTTLY